MNTFMKMLLLVGLLAASPTWLLGDTVVYTYVSNQSGWVTVVVPYCADIEVHGCAYGPDTSYIRGTTPIGSFYRTPSAGALHMIGTVQAGTYNIYLEVGSSGYVCLMVMMHPPEEDSSFVPVYVPHSSYAGSMRGIYGFAQTPGVTTYKTRPEMVDILRSKLGWPTLGTDADQNSKRLLDAGPLGLPYLIMTRRFLNSQGRRATWREIDPNADLPEKTTTDSDNSTLGFLEAYPTMQAALDHACAAGTRWVIFCKIGVWSDYVGNSAPEPFQSSGQIPLQSVSDPNPGQHDAKYWVYLDNKWYTFTHGIDALPGTPQQGTVINVGDPEPAPGEAIIFFKRCVPIHQWEHPAP